MLLTSHPGEVKWYEWHFELPGTLLTWDSKLTFSKKILITRRCWICLIYEIDSRYPTSSLIRAIYRHTSMIITHHLLKNDQNNKLTKEQTCSTNKSKYLKSTVILREPSLIGNNPWGISRKKGHDIGGKTQETTAFTTWHKKGIMTVCEL